MQGPSSPGRFISTKYAMFRKHFYIVSAHLLTTYFKYIRQWPKISGFLADLVRSLDTEQPWKIYSIWEPPLEQEEVNSLGPIVDISAHLSFLLMTIADIFVQRNRFSSH